MSDMKQKGEEMEQAEVLEQPSEEAKQIATRRARERARTTRWDLDIAVFLFAVLIIIIILLFQEVRIEIVAPVAVFGLAMVWLCGWRRGRNLYNGFYDEELAILMQEPESKEKQLEETVEEQVQKALRERLQ